MLVSSERYPYLQMQQTHFEVKSCLRVATFPTPDSGTPMTQNFLNSVQFFGKFGKIVCWLPLPDGWRPLLKGILNQAL